MTKALLDVRGVAKSFGSYRVLEGVSLQVKAGEVLGLLGPNGSGKSTLLNIISGFYDADGGVVEFDGRDVTSTAAHERARAGLVRTFQLPAMPARMATQQVALAADSEESSVLGSIFRGARYRRAEVRTRDRANAFIDAHKLNDVRRTASSLLSGGQKKLLALSCAMMNSPRLVCLDEPTAGVHVTRRSEMAVALRGLAASGTAVLVVEHDMRFIRAVCDRCVVIDRGHVVADCPPAELTSNERVLSAYLGTRGKKC